MHSYRGRPVVIMVATITLLLLVGSVAAAQTNPDSSAQPNKTAPASQSDDDNWRVVIGAFGWFPGVHGTVGAQGHNVAVHVNGTDVLSNLQFSLLGAFEIQKKRFVAPMDYAWVNLATTSALPLNDAGQTEARAELHQAFFTPKFGYRVVNTNVWKVDVVGGIRYWHLGQSITLRPSNDLRSVSGDWVDGVGGGSIQLEVHPKAFIRVMGDAGAGGANLDYQVAGWFGYRATRMMGVIAGWRYMDVDYRGNNQFIYDAAQNGPLVGMTLNFGGKPAPSPSAGCSVSPQQVMVGEPVVARIRTENFNPKHPVSYAWSGTGLTLSSTSDAVTIDTASVAPGTYNVTGAATDPKLKKNNVASCTGSFTVKELPKHPPTASCTSSPDSVKAGDLATITVTGNSPDGRPLTYAYTSTAGQIKGSGASVSLDTAMAAPGSTITATATVTDDRGLSATCDASIAVLAPPVVVQEASEIGRCNFKNAKKPARVDNECKAILDEVALRLQREPDGKVYVVGYEEEEERINVTQVGARRAVSIKKYLTQGEGKAGIDQARVIPVKGKAASRTGKIYFVAAGATFTAEESETIDETEIQGQ